jgi:hypothetical protein
MVSIVSVFLVKPNGILALPLQTAPAVVALYALLAVLGVRRLRAQRREVRRGAVAQPPLSEALLEPR